MTTTVAQLWRYPIKGIGAEALDHVEMATDLPFPLDRAWAVLEEGGDASDGWRSCRNFLRAAKGPSLMAISARVEGDLVHLSHPEHPDLSINPHIAEDANRLIAWLTAMYPATRRPPVELVASPPQGMSDAPFASVSIMNMSSLRAVSQKSGQPLDTRRFRGNIWLEGLAPWEEFDLVGKTISINDAQLELIEPIVRCRATEANPDTGQRDIAMLNVLEDGWGHSEFGVNAQVRRSGSAALNDKVEVL